MHWNKLVMLLAMAILYNHIFIIDFHHKQPSKDAVKLVLRDFDVVTANPKSSQRTRWEVVLRSNHTNSETLRKQLIHVSAIKSVRESH